ncbi:MAG: isochorismatase family protein [Desulfurivibrio sp.]|jgi:nicotinamidase-related amidase|nr:MAG: isochorismatase family protein [Desulfurivibrio sp.]
MAITKRLEPARCGLLVVDIQERMMRVIPEREEVVKNSVLLLKAARILKLPVVATTQYAARIGELLPEISAEMGEIRPLDKLEFGCFDNREALAAIRACSAVDSWIVCGVETHICIYQTVLGGLREGYAMWVPADAVNSRAVKNYQTGLERIRQVGGAVGNTEMIIYELLQQAGTPEFKAMLPFIK